MKKFTWECFTATFVGSSGAMAMYLVAVLFEGWNVQPDWSIVLLACVISFFNGRRWERIK